MKKIRKNPDELVKQLRQELSLSTSLNGEKIRRALNISQPTLSRVLKLAGPSVVQLRDGRHLQYALPRIVVKPSWAIPIFLIDNDGKAIHGGDLKPIGDRAFFVSSRHAAIKDFEYPDIPYWLDDLRPSGFLGRLIPRIHNEFPSDILRWSGDNCLQYWCRYGDDLIGNIILGEQAFDLFTQHAKQIPVAVPDGQELSRFTEIAKDVVAKGIAGSSAGGEQPKFLCTKLPNLDKKIVKFSPAESGELSVRRKDLLVCEHIAHKLLRLRGKSASSSSLHIGAERIFLEIDRFDRIGKNGRVGMLSLRSLGEHFLGSVGSWKEIGNSLRAEGKITDVMADEIRWRFYFGEYIANSDMHNANLSLFVYGEDLLDLAPIYDMLPMLYAPKNEEVVPVQFEPRPYPPNDALIAESAKICAFEYWQMLSNETRLSTEFRRIATENSEKLKSV